MDHRNSDAAVWKAAQSGGPMEDRLSEINEPIIREEYVLRMLHNQGLQRVKILNQYSRKRKLRIKGIILRRK